MSKINFQIQSDPKNLKIVRKNLSTFLSSQKITGKDEGSIVLAVDEAVQNIMRYAYQLNPTHPIDFEFEKKDTDLIVKIRDYGKQVPIDQIKPRDLDDVKPGGLGVHFIKSISKEMSYQHQDQGTLLTLVF